MAHEFKHPLLGQEAIYGRQLGRVVDYRDDFPHQWIKIRFYSTGIEWHCSPKNVSLVQLPPTEPCCG